MTYVDVLLLLFRHLFLWRLHIVVDSGSFQTDVIQGVLVRYVDVLLSRDELHLNLIAYSLHRAQVDCGCGVGSLGSPR